jgi:hypothetical protein
MNIVSSPGRPPVVGTIVPREATKRSWSVPGLAVDRRGVAGIALVGRVVDPAHDPEVVEVDPVGRPGCPDHRVVLVVLEQRLRVGAALAGGL